MLMLHARMAALDYFQTMAAFSVLAALFILAASVAIVAQGEALAVGRMLPTPPFPVGATSCFFAAQLADPQFGIVNGASSDPAVALDWSAERANLDLAVRELNRLAPRVAFLSGDMQNWDPTAANHGALAGHGDVGARQAAEVQRSLSRLRVPMHGVTPGNHDIGDTPTPAALDAYERRWGADRSSFSVEGVRFLSFNSLLLRDAPGDGARAAREAQLAWLAEELRTVRSTNTSGVVLLTHVPPFVGAPDEPAGWANWPSAERARLADVLATAAMRPRVVICGHFHANALTSADSFGGAPLRVITTSSVACPIRWNGAESLEPAEASQVAAAPDGGHAFESFVLRTGGRGEANFSLIAERVTPRPDVAGVRLFEFCPRRGSYRHRWLTLTELGATKRLVEGRTLAGVSFEPLR